MAIQPSLFTFLLDLNENNNRDWFHKNKKRYESELKEPWKAFVGEVIEGFKTLEPSFNIEPKDVIFRINRDIRFSKDKTPYKTNVSAIFTPTGRKGKAFPGYYLHLEAGRLMVGGGSYFLEKDALLNIRNHIVTNSGKLEKIIQKPSFAKVYESLDGAKNKRMPKDLQPHIEANPYILHKQFFAMNEMPSETIMADDAVEKIMRMYKELKPLNVFLREGMGI